jgi:hypothetical protein
MYKTVLGPGPTLRETLRETLDGEEDGEDGEKEGEKEGEEAGTSANRLMPWTVKVSCKDLESGVT